MVRSSESGDRAGAGTPEAPSPRGWRNLDLLYGGVRGPIGRAAWGELGAPVG